MNLSPSLGYRQAIDEILEAPGVFVLPVMTTGSRRRLSKAERPSIGNGMAFAMWATKLRTFPTVEQVRDHFDVCRATAYRWRDMWGEVIKVAPPPVERLPSSAASTRSRKARGGAP